MSAKIQIFFISLLFFSQKNTKEDVIWTEIVRNDTEMGCDGGDLETNEPNCVLM